MSKKSYKATALAYVDSVLTGKRNAGADEIAACRRFLADCERPDLELRTKDPDFVIGIMPGIVNRLWAMSPLYAERVAGAPPSGS